MMRIAICDDESKIRGSIWKMLKLAYREQRLEWIEPGLYETGDTLLEDLRQGTQYDLIYLDIEMPGRSGMEIAAGIRQFDKQVQIIFVTSHAHYVYDAFRVMPLDFLSKPIDCKRFKDAFNRALENYRWHHQTITCQVEDKLVVLLIKDILYLNSQGKWMIFYMKGGATYKTRQTITEMEKKMKMYHILRCYRSNLVNLAYVREIAPRVRLRIGERNDGKDVVVIDPTYPQTPIRLPIGEKYFSDFQAALIRYQEEGRQVYC